MHLRPQSEGKDKLYARWESAMSVGVREKLREFYMITAGRGSKVTKFRSGLEVQTQNQDEFFSSKGLPWENVPGMNIVEIKPVSDKRGRGRDNPYVLQSRKCTQEGIHHEEGCDQMKA